MPDCVPFLLYVGDQIEAIVADLRSEVVRHGGSTSGELPAGVLSIALPMGGSLSGSYRIEGKSIRVSINSRPAFVSCGTIESKLQDLILDAKARLKNRK